MLHLLLSSIGGVLIICALIGIIASGYVKSPPNVAYIISGFRKEPRVLIGRAGIKLPFLERKDVLLVKQISVDIKTNGYIPTQDFIGVDVDAVAKIRVKTDGDGIQIAMKNFLNMSESDIVSALTDSLQGNMREIIGTITLKDICNDRKKFGDEVQEKAQKDMNALGIEIISCNIQRVDDENNLINALGQDNMAQIQKDASIAKANADKEVAIAEANAQEQANKAKVDAAKIIAERNNELALKEAELKAVEETKRAIAEAAYEQEKQTQQKTVVVRTQEAEIAKREKEIELQTREAEVAEKKLDAEVRKKAEAEKFAAQQKADADLYVRQKEAEAQLVEKQKAAEAIKVQGEAEAEAIRAKGLAEAETIEKKAEAMKQYGQAAMMEMIVNVLPDIAKNVAEPLASIEKVSIIGGDGSGISQVSNNVPVVMQQVFETVKETTGLDLKDVVMANSKTAKTDRNITVKTDMPLKEAVSDKEEDSNTATKPETENVQNKKDASEKETAELMQKAANAVEKTFKKKK